MMYYIQDKKDARCRWLIDVCKIEGNMLWFTRYNALFATSRWCESWDRTGDPLRIPNTYVIIPLSKLAKLLYEV